MNRTSLRCCMKRLVVPLALLLIAVWFVGGAHQHADGGTHHACAVCSASHSPALSNAAVPFTTALAALEAHVVVPPSEVPHRGSTRPPRGRAPPTC